MVIFEDIESKLKKVHNQSISILAIRSKKKMCKLRGTECILTSSLLTFNSNLQALLFGAWVCILKYYDMAIFKNTDDSKEAFFRGITIFAWVMVIVLVLPFIFSFDKTCSRPSRWTLAVRQYPALPHPRASYN